jgi:hypothetical protein
MEALTVALIVVLSALTLVLFAFLMTYIDAIKRGRSTAGVVLKKNDIEELLSKGKSEAAKKAASEWMRRESMNTSAYMLLIKAEFRLGKYIEAKKAIEELVEFAPEFEFSTRTYTTRINEKLKNSRPRAVD